MPFSELDPKARQKEQQLESFLQLWMRKFLPTLHRTPGLGGRESQDIKLWPVQQGSQMPAVDPHYLMERSRTRGKGGPA